MNGAVAFMAGESVKISKTNKSEYIEALPSTAHVLKPVFRDDVKPCVLEQISVSTTGGSELVKGLGQMGDLAETMSLQRKLKPERRDAYVDDMKDGRMPTITVEVLILKYDNNTIILADGRTRLAAAVKSKWSGLLNINVREADTNDDATAFISRLDSALGRRSKDNMLGYYFPDRVNNSKKHIGFVNTAIQNIIVGCPDKSMATIKESSPHFPRMTLFSHPQLVYLRDHHKTEIDWFQNNFPIGKGNKFLSVGTVTAIILTKLIDGSEVADYWKRFVSGENIPGATFKFREELRAMKILPAGQAGQSLLFQKALHAYLAEKKLFNAHSTVFTDGSKWQITHGKASDPEPEHIRKPKQTKQAKQGKKAKKSKK